MLPGVFCSKKKDGTEYFRSNITHRGKHISLGSFPTEEEAFEAFCDAKKILAGEITLQEILDCFSVQEDEIFFHLSFEKCISLANFHNHGLYIANPIYLRRNYFSYYLSVNEEYKFDIDDLFYYSQHKIMKRKGHLFVSDYGVQTTIGTRYGLKPHAVLHRDYEFVNGDETDLRYSNIEIINSYFGVTKFEKNGAVKYRAKIHINGNYTIGVYSTAEKAAVAYNKAVDLAKKAGISRNFPENYIDGMSAPEYAELYHKVRISQRYIAYLDKTAAAGVPVDRDCRDKR